LITDFDRYWLLEFSQFFFNYTRVGLMLMQSAPLKKTVLDELALETQYSVFGKTN
jgi:hypothetical protein